MFFKFFILLFLLILSKGINYFILKSFFKIYYKPIYISFSYLFSSFKNLLNDLI